MTAARKPLLPWVVWGVGVLAYAVAIINRSSLAALGPATQEHFGIEATMLSMFAVIQLVVYAALQIPVGLLLDRYGSTALILAGGTLMFIGQAVMASVADARLAILARVLVGAGDACTFISVIKLLPDWFALRQLPVVTQATGLIGQAGQLVSVVPLALAVTTLGWTTGFLGLAAVGLIVVILGALVLRNKPGDSTTVERILRRRGRVTREARSFAGQESTTEMRAVAPPATEMIQLEAASQKRRPKRSESLFARLAALLRIPGVRLAFWVHFTPPFSILMLLLLWGTPFLTGGVGLSTSASAALLSLAVVSSMVAGLTMGSLTSRFVERRIWFVISVIVLIVVVWSAVLLWPGTPPTWLLTVLMIVVPFGGPASMVSFEVVRSHSPRSYLGAATGMVNMGSFVAALIIIFFIGIALDAQGAGSPENYTLDAFKWAFALQVPLWLIGLTMIGIELRNTRRWMQDRGRTLR